MNLGQSRGSHAIWSCCQPLLDLQARAACWTAIYPEPSCEWAHSHTLGLHVPSITSQHSLGWKGWHHAVRELVQQHFVEDHKVIVPSIHRGLEALRRKGISAQRRWETMAGHLSPPLPPLTPREPTEIFPIPHSQATWAKQPLPTHAHGRQLREDTEQRLLAGCHAQDKLVHSRASRQSNLSLVTVGEGKNPGDARDVMSLKWSGVGGPCHSAFYLPPQQQHWEPYNS